MCAVSIGAHRYIKIRWRDVGLNFYYSLPFTMEPYEAYEDTPVGEVMSYGYWTVKAVADYNYRRWFKTHPFAGVGVGGGKSIMRTYTGMDYTEDPEYPVPVYSLKHTPIAIQIGRAHV